MGTSNLKTKKKSNTLKGEREKVRGKQVQSDGLLGKKERWTNPEAKCYRPICYYELTGFL